jgi:hypothetical protein
VKLSGGFSTNVVIGESVIIFETGSSIPAHATRRPAYALISPLRMREGLTRSGLCYRSTQRTGCYDSPSCSRRQTRSSRMASIGKYTENKFGRRVIALGAKITF